MHDDLRRATELLAQMTIEEKAQQVVGTEPFGLMSSTPPRFNQLQASLAGGVGHVCMFAMFQHQTLIEHARRVNQIQRHLIANTRLGIPAMFHIEALNGLVAPHFTVFPTGIALAATWNPDAIEQMASIVGRQARALGYFQALSPVLDVARDARWGRVHETYGEDPLLVSSCGVAFVRGLQGSDLRHGTLATGKHFVGFAMTEGGQHMSASVVSGRELREVYARPFEAAIHHAGMQSVMNSYSSVDGIPVVANHAILRTLLRDDLGFSGSVVADYGSVEHLVSRTEIAEDVTDAARLALEAGLDLELPGAVGFGPALAAAVRSGAIPEERLDEATLRVLYDKFSTGLMDNPFASEDEAELRREASEGTEESLDLARQSVVLISNSGELPLTSSTRRIAVIGPHGDSAVVGFPAYTFIAALGLLGAVDQGEGANMAGLENSALPDAARAALRSQLSPELTDGFNAYARRHYGSESLVDALRRLSNAEVEFVEGSGVLDDEPGDIDAAVQAAKAADMVVLALGGRAGWFGSRQTEGEGSDHADIDLPATQLDLARAVAATGTPVIGVVYAGRPIALTALSEAVPTLVYANYGGQYASTAVAEILLGVTSPSGRLPISLPRHSGQIPVHVGQHTGSGYRRTVSDPHDGYNDMSAAPLFPFGHGLSYSTVEYSDLQLAEAVVTPNEVMSVSVSITNTGDRSAVEVVQFYAADRAPGLTRPAQQLIAFARAHLEPGESRTVTAEVPLRQLAYVDGTGKLVLHPGPVEIQVGASSRDIRGRTVQRVEGPTADYSRSHELMPRVRVGAPRRP